MNYSPEFIQAVDDGRIKATLKLKQQIARQHERAAAKQEAREIRSFIRTMHYWLNKGAIVDLENC